MTSNLVDWIDEMSEFEKAFILRHLNLCEEGMNVSLGTLPFVNRGLVRKVLHRVSREGKDAEMRKAKKLLEKFGPGIENTKTFAMTLDDAKVLRWSFGSSTAHRIMRLPFKKVIGAGIQWNAFKRKWVKPDTELHEQAVVSLLRPGVWNIEVNKRFASATREYLFAQYGAGAMEIERKKKRGR